MSKVKQLQPKTEGQKTYLKSIQENKITICTGPAGTGKTMMASRYAAQELFSSAYSRIIIMRPMVQAGENTGFLPGDINEKMNPYIRPVLDELSLYLNQTQLNEYIAKQIVEVVPFAFARGRSFHNSFIIIDECQNATYEQLVLAITRFGRNSKMVINGDMDQSDLPRHQVGGLLRIIDRIKNIPDIGVIELTYADIVREPIITKILSSLSMENSPDLQIP